jgi:hypothetical protein
MHKCIATVLKPGCCRVEFEYDLFALPTNSRLSLPAMKGLADDFLAQVHRFADIQKWKPKHFAAASAFLVAEAAE